FYLFCFIALILACVFPTLVFNIFSRFPNQDAATTYIYTLSLHDALPISVGQTMACIEASVDYCHERETFGKSIGKHQLVKQMIADRKSTRLNSSHVSISYAVFCLKKNIINKRTKTNAE